MVGVCAVHFRVAANDKATSIHEHTYATEPRLPLHSQEDTFRRICNHSGGGEILLWV